MCAGLVISNDTNDENKSIFKQKWRPSQEFGLIVVNQIKGARKQVKNPKQNSNNFLTMTNLYFMKNKNNKKCNFTHLNKILTK